MIEGVLRHCTEMEVEKNYVDSHGQSEVAFAFCRLLGFHLLPRLKALHAQKLYRPETGRPDAYLNLQPVLTRPIDWDLIERQYDEMVKYATACGWAQPNLRTFCVASPETTCGTLPIKRLPSWAKHERRRSCAAIYTCFHCDARSTKGSMWSRTGTVPTTSFFMAGAARSLPIASRIKRLLC
jgi:hypothetical protein